jgi:Reprolysin family propeptide.
MHKTNVSDHDNFYDGRLFGEVSSAASVHLEDGVMTATIHAPEETYHIEVLYFCL